MQKLRNFRNQKGFTLVEIAIVLVIVGLVLFGVLKGQELIKSGKVKKSIKQVDQIRAAIVTYGDKYKGKLPGVNGGVNATSAGVFQDLADAKLISYIDPPGMTNGFGGAVTATLNTTTNKIEIVSAALPEYAAELLDIALDDGDGTKGDILNGSTPAAYTAPATATSVDLYIIQD